MAERDAGRGGLSRRLLHRRVDGLDRRLEHLEDDERRRRAGRGSIGTGASELDAISFSAPLNGWATGYSNLVLHTTDGGQNWVAQDVPAPPLTAITGVTAIDANTAWIAGWYGFVAVTRDGGQTWRREIVPDAGEVDIEDLLFLDAQRGWVGGNIGLWKRVAGQ